MRHKGVCKRLQEIRTKAGTKAPAKKKREKDMNREEESKQAWRELGDAWTEIYEELHTREGEG